MSDTIDRQAAIDALCRRCDLAADDDGPCTEKCNDIKILEKLPHAESEQQWIPVSERLPDEYEYVLLCDREPDEDTGYSRMAVGWLEGGKICCWDDRATREEFVAWMPLPEPYKEDNNG